MKIRHRTLRALGLTVSLLLLGSVALFYVLAFVAERILEGERRFGEVTLHVHGPRISPLLAVRADSIEMRSTGFKLMVLRPEGRLSDWLGLRPSTAALVLRADSMDVDLREVESKKSKAVEFPTALRIPLDMTLQWRVLTVRTAGIPRLEAGPARWRNRGSQGLHGVFGLRLPGAPSLQAELDARWRGPALRYRFEASRPGDASLQLSGIREKRDLRQGFDSVTLFLANPRVWLPKAAASDFPPLSRLDIAGKADWRRDSLRLSGRFATPGHPPLEAAAWNVALRLGPGGGRIDLAAAGVRQSLKVRGNWRHPGGSLSLPAWSRWSGEFSGEFRGGEWALSHWTLPLDFEVPAARLDSGLRVAARLVTRDASTVDVRWNGRRPDRVELTADVSPTEPWALIWTDTNVAFSAARVKGVWDRTGLHATANVRSPRAYGAVADSLEAVNDVTATGYFLRRGRIYRDGEIFTGEGKVIWRDPAGRHVVSLDFAAEHPEHGRATVAMRGDGGLELTADSLHASRFPYEPLRRFAPFEPRVHGRFAWNAVARTGDATLDGRFKGEGGDFAARLEAEWLRDSLRVRKARLAAGESRLEGGAVLPFDGRSWADLWGAHRLMSGAWNVQAVRVNPEEVMALAGRHGAEYHALISGQVDYSPDRGMRGEMRLDSARMPLGNAFALTAGGFTGTGDTLRAHAVFASRRTPRQDTVRAFMADLRTISPFFRMEVGNEAAWTLRAEGRLESWQNLQARARLSGRALLGEKSGSLENIALEGEVTAPLNRSFARNLRLEGKPSSFSHVSARDTFAVLGTPAYANGVLRIPDVRLRNNREEELAGWLEADILHGHGRAEIGGERLGWILPSGERVRARNLAAVAAWDSVAGTRLTLRAGAGFVTLPTSPHRVESGFDELHAEVTLPPARAEGASPRLKVRGRIHDFLFQRKWGWRDVTAFFTGFNRGGRGSTTASAKRARPWELDVEVDVAGARNRVDTDVLRMNFTGDARVTGVYPYMLVQGKMTGLQGEVGQPRQAYSLRDFEVKWDNVTVEDGVLSVEGEKKLRSDCRADTRQSCQIYIHLGGRLEDVEFTYDTDCGENAGEPVPPAVLINSMAQGCYVSETPGGSGNYGTAAFAMLEPALNARLSREVSRGSGGFIKSTQVSGLSALMGDSTGLESVALEVESRELYRVGLKGRVGYHPETKLANPMEYRLAAEYRPPLERLSADSAWRARLKDRFTVEAAAETRPEGRDIEEERRVRQRAGLRYRYRFWNLW